MSKQFMGTKLPHQKIKDRNSIKIMISNGNLEVFQSLILGICTIQVVVRYTENSLFPSIVYWRSTLLIISNNIANECLHTYISTYRDVGGSMDTFIHVCIAIQYSILSMREFHCWTCERSPRRWGRSTLHTAARQPPWEAGQISTGPSHDNYYIYHYCY